ASSFGADLTAAVAAARALGPVAVDPALLAMAAELTPEQLTLDTVAALAAGLGYSLSPGAAPLPARRAPIHTLVEAAAPPVREALFSAFLRLLQRPVYE